MTMINNPVSAFLIIRRNKGSLKKVVKEFSGIRGRGLWALHQRNICMTVCDQEQHFGGRISLQKYLIPQVRDRAFRKLYCREARAFQSTAFQDKQTDKQTQKLRLAQSTSTPRLIDPPIPQLSQLCLPLGGTAPVQLFY